MNRLESIKERIDNYKSEYLPYFNNNGEMHEWHAMFEDTQYLLQRIERYEQALKEINSIELTQDGPTMYNNILNIKNISGVALEQTQR